MSKKKEFGEGIIYTITNYIWWLLLGNFYFWLVNILFIFVFLSMLLSGVTSMNWLLTLSLIPIGPAFTALLSVMGKLTREGDVSVTKEFFKAYKVNFWESLFCWTMEIIFLTIFWVDALFMNSHSNLRMLAIIPKALFFITIGLTFYVFPILSRFYIRKKELLKLALKYMVKKIYVLIIVFAAIYIAWMALLKINALVVILFATGIISYIIMFLEKGMLQEIEDTIKGKDGTTEEQE